MADNTTLNVMAGGDVIADEDIAGVKFQKIKIVNGTPGSTTPLKVTATGGVETTPDAATATDINDIATNTGATATATAALAAPTASTAVSTAATAASTATLADPATVFKADVRQLGGTAVQTAGVAGVQAIGGADAISGAATTNPLVAGGVDSTGIVRRLKVDTSGRMALAPPTTGSAGATGAPAIPVSINDTAEGDTVAGLLARLLRELMMTNYYLSNLSFNLNNGYDEKDPPEVLRGDNSMVPPIN